MHIRNISQNTLLLAAALYVSSRFRSRATDPFQDIALSGTINMSEIWWLSSSRGCPRRNVPDFGRVFLMLKYTDITQNTCVQCWTVTEIMAREMYGLLAGPHTVPVSWQSYPFPSLSVVSYDGNSAHAGHITSGRTHPQPSKQHCFRYSIPLDACRKLYCSWWRTLWTITVKQVLILVQLCSRLIPECAVSHFTSPLSILMYSAWNPKDNYDMSASVFVVQFNCVMSLTS